MKKKKKVRLDASRHRLGREKASPGVWLTKEASALNPGSSP